MSENPTQEPRQGPAATAAGPAMLRITELRRSAGAGRARLARGDILIAVEGQPFAGTADTLEDRIKTAPTPPVLTFLRAGVVFHVFGHAPFGATFGPLEPDEAAEAAAAQARLEALIPEPGHMRAFDIFRNRNGWADLRDRSNSFMAMIAPPLWMLNQRFYEGAVASTLTIATAFVVHWVLGFMALVLMCLYVGREQQGLTRSFLLYRNFYPIYALAAANELEAQRTTLALNPNLAFVFSADPSFPRAPVPPEPAPGATPAE